jgi:hypothetical protein
MSRLWTTAAANSGVPEEDLKRTALMLVCGQILYYSNTQHRTAYQLIRANRAAFTEVLDHLGLRLGIDDEYRMIYVTTEGDTERLLPQDESLLALVLRYIHHEKSKVGEADNGVVTINTVELYSTYQMLTHRELPKHGEGKDRQVLYEAMRRYGFMKVEERDPDSDAPPDIRILPGIAALISIDSLNRIRPSEEQTTSTEPSVGVAPP